MGRVNNSTYASYLELGRMDFCDRYLKIKELKDIPFVLVRVEMDIQASLRPGMQAEVCTSVARIGTSAWDFAASIREVGTQRLFVQARTVQVYFDYHADRSCPIPADFRRVLEAEMDPAAGMLLETGLPGQVRSKKPSR